MLIKIYADFNSTNEDDKVRLNTVGSIKDIEQYEGLLKNGMKVILYMEEIEVEALLEFNETIEIWLGVPDWSTIKYLY